MVEDNLEEELFSRLSGECYEALNNAVKFCEDHRYDEVQLAHWLQELLRPTVDCDLPRIISFFSLSPTAIETEIAAAIDKGLPGRTSVTGISSDSPLRGLVR